MTKAAGLRGTSLPLLSAALLSVCANTAREASEKIISNATKINKKGEASATKMEAVVEESPLEAAWKQAVGSRPLL